MLELKVNNMKIFSAFPTELQKAGNDGEWNYLIFVMHMISSNQITIHC